MLRSRDRKSKSHLKEQKLNVHNPLINMRTKNPPLCFPSKHLEASGIMIKGFRYKGRERSLVSSINIRILIKDVWLLFCGPLLETWGSFDDGLC